MKIIGLTPTQYHRLSLKLKPIFIGELAVVKHLDNPAFHYENGVYKRVLDAHEEITPEFISQHAQTYSSQIFLFKEDLKQIKLKLKSDLNKLARSLSIGDVKKNTLKHTHFLSMQMNNLYQDPYNDELLTGQFQNSKNLEQILSDNKEIRKDIFQNIQQSNHHYTLTQPLLSSILLLSFLQELKLFSPREIQGLFLTSYFKDIGMSFIPREKFELANLNEFDKDLFSQHATNSLSILSGRIPLTPTQLNLIENHHFLNYKIQALMTKSNRIKPNETILTGIESTLFSALDILVAMTSDRPYRKAISSYKALELLRRVIAEQYPHEFKALVIFLKNFLSK